MLIAGAIRISTPVLRHSRNYFERKLGLKNLKMCSLSKNLQLLQFTSSVSTQILKINPTLLYSSKVDVPINVPEPIISSKNLAQFKKGTGGRSSFSGHVVTGAFVLP